jgi:hypothetical protein
MSDLNFRIESSPKAFDILASNLYSDKVSAVIRELSCNAADAHAEAGVPQIPFEVTLPTSSLSYFKVRDFGHGLKADQIEDVFTVFFSSTKIGSKVYTGAFGLGCKSPFAITNSFYVNSYINGKKFYYNCCRKDGIPSISMLKEEPTSEKNGLEIIVPLSSYSQKEWEDKAQDIFDVFKIRPIVNIKLQYFTESPEYKYGPNWDNTKKSGTWVVMNNVRYRLDIKKIYPELNQAYPLISKQYFTNCSKGICFHVPPRSVEVTPSREQISYTPSTIEFLNNFITKVDNEFYGSIQESLNKCESKINAQMLFLNICKKFYDEHFHNDRLTTANAFTWNGNPLSDYAFITPQIYYNETIEIGRFYKICRYSSNITNKLFTNTDFQFSEDPNLETLFFLINDTKASQETIRSWVNRKAKSLNRNVVSFLVVKEEYAFILKDYNKINNKFISKCSALELYKSNVKSKAKNTAKNIVLHTYDIDSNTFIKSNDNCEEDIIEDIITDKRTVYFIEYQAMHYLRPESVDINSIVPSTILLYKNLDELQKRISSLTKQSNHLPNKFISETNKILLIKDLKKNKEFMRRYTKQNKIRFISYKTYIANTFDKYCEENPCFLDCLIDKFVINFWRSSGNCFPQLKYESCEVSNKLLIQDFCDKMEYFCKNISYFEQYQSRSNELDYIYSFLRTNKFGQQCSQVSNSILFLFSTTCGCDPQKFKLLIEKHCNKSLVFYDQLVKFWENNPAIFFGVEEKTKKIIEYYMTGKIS